MVLHGLTSHQAMQQCTNQVLRICLSTSIVGIFFTKLNKMNPDPFYLSERLTRQGQQMFQWQHDHVQGAVQYQQHMQEAKEHQCNINSMQCADEVPQVYLDMMKMRVYHS